MSEDLQGWLKERRLLIRILGYQGMDAVLDRPHLDQIASDLRAWRAQATKYLASALAVIALATLSHFLLTGRAIRTAYFLAYALGLIGTIVAAYGFAVHSQGLAPARKHREFISLPLPPRSESEAFHYGAGLNDAISRFMKVDIETRWHGIRLELRRQASLATGMMFLSVSFLMQMGLQFIDM